MYVDVENERAVRRAIVSMRADVSRQLGIEDLARVALLSTAHFSRTFRRVTGIPPGRFLTAVRLQEAKRLLASTSLHIAEVSGRVGYRSVGTFSSRFTRSVGVSPATYRRSDRPPATVTNGRRLDRSGCGTVRGHLALAPAGPLRAVLVALFPDPIAEGQPVSWAIQQPPGPFLLSRVPAGRWHLLSYPVAGSTGWSDDEPVAATGPITLHGGTIVEDVRVRLMPRRLIDPPVLLASVHTLG
jgi:AraC family transcriptional regulator